MFLAILDGSDLVETAGGFDLVASEGVIRNHAFAGGADRLGVFAFAPEVAFLNGRVAYWGWTGGGESGEEGKER